MLLPPLPPAAVCLLVRNHSPWTSLSCLSSVSAAPQADCDNAVNQLRGWSGFWVLSCWLTFSSQHTELKGQGRFELRLRGCRQLKKKQIKSHFFVKIVPFSLHPLHQKHSGIHPHLWAGPAFSGGSETRGRIQIKRRPFNFYLSNIKVFAQRCKSQPVNQSVTM